MRDAAVLLGALTGTDEHDEKTLESDGHAHDDYTRFLHENGLEGKRIGFYTTPLGQHFRLETLMQQEVRRIESLGAEIVDIDRIASEDIGGDGFQVLLYEFKDGLPVGLSVFGRAWSEPVLLEIAYAYEQATYHRMVPAFQGQ